MNPGTLHHQPSPVVAVIDVGSNSIKSLVAARSAEGGVLVVDEHTLETRISAGISREAPELVEASMQQGTEAIAALAERIRTYQPARIAAVATSAVRDARNGKAFCDRVRAEAGVELQVLSGADEARLIGLGVLLDASVRALGAFYMLDLGGGSLELLGFAEGGTLLQKVSLQLGAVRLTEKFITDKNTPIPGSVLKAVADHVKGAVGQSGFAIRGQVPFLVGSGGAIVYTRSLLAQRKGMGHWHAHPSMLFRDELASLAAELASQSLEDRMKLAALPRQRADIMPVALATLVAVLEMADAVGLQHSVYNLRYGLAAELLQGF